MKKITTSSDQRVGFAKAQQCFLSRAFVQDIELIRLLRTCEVQMSNFFNSNVNIRLIPIYFFIAIHKYFRLNILLIIRRL